MNAAEFAEALAEYSSKPADEIEMQDGLRDIGVDSVSIFEFSMKIEDRIGGTAVELTEDVKTVQDLFEAVQDAAEEASA
ncbi:acyl carrier protein [Clavibacter michiganensis]|uniref:phosphopantetheine-binding protein n=1 Tax=Clavibacter michiganensis TaxID=28447 RepID=UPI00195D22A3|nr:phosphopantetheine-binding protein [Clavibacter michiganensis]MBM7411140.1 acyl carrier protein [Clavibacter michiganensis]